jgi:hypothetical protein
MAIGLVIGWSIDYFNFARLSPSRGLRDRAAGRAVVKVLHLGLINSINLPITVGKTIGRGRGGHHHGMAHRYSWSK